MKKLVLFSLIFATIFIFFIMVADLLNPKNTIQNNSNKTQATDIQAKSSISSPASTIILTSSEIAKHAVQSDCWSIYNNKVLNITNYFGQHPGGDRRLLAFCGKDMTQAFDQQGHSDYARSLMDNYYIGDLNASFKNQTNSK